MTRHQLKHQLVLLRSGTRGSVRAGRYVSPVRGVRVSVGTGDDRGAGDGGGRGRPCSLIYPLCKRRRQHQAARTPGREQAVPLTSSSLNSGLGSRRDSDKARRSPCQHESHPSLFTQAMWDNSEPPLPWMTWLTPVLTRADVADTADTLSADIDKLCLLRDYALVCRPYGEDVSSSRKKKEGGAARTSLLCGPGLPALSLTLIAQGIDTRACALRPITDHNKR